MWWYSWTYRKSGSIKTISRYNECSALLIGSSGYNECSALLIGLGYNECSAVLIGSSGYNECSALLIGSSGHNECSALLVDGSSIAQSYKPKAVSNIIEYIEKVFVNMINQKLQFFQRVDKSTNRHSFCSIFYWKQKKGKQRKW